MFASPHSALSSKFPKQNLVAVRLILLKVPHGHGIFTMPMSDSGHFIWSPLGKLVLSSEQPSEYPIKTVKFCLHRIELRLYTFGFMCKQSWGFLHYKELNN